MNEVKKPQKPLIFYYLIVMIVLMLFNSLAVPWLMERQIQEVSYGTFMSMTEEGNIGRVQIEDNQITFTNKEETQIYKTGVVEDPNRAERLYANGITDFGSEIVEETSPLLTILLY